MKPNAVDWIAFILVIIGSLNWGLVGLFQYDLVATIFGGAESTVSRTIYTLVGLSALWLIYTITKITSWRTMAKAEKPGMKRAA